VEAASAHCSEIDLILLDLRMPVMTGVAATRLVREQSETYRVPIAAMSAHCECDWRDEARIWKLRAMASTNGLK